MYVIVDWHVLNDKDPNVHRAEAAEFFDQMAAKWKDQDNVIYEICNEPNSGTSWEMIKAYANESFPLSGSMTGTRWLLWGRLPGVRRLTRP